MTCRFPDLRTLLAKATPLRSHDQLAGLAAETSEERIHAQMALADTPLRRFLSEPVIPYEIDEVTGFQSVENLEVDGNGAVPRPAPLLFSE